MTIEELRACRDDILRIAASRGASNVRVFGKERHPEISWSQIAAFRHRVVHDYLSGFDLQLALSFI